MGRRQKYRNRRRHLYALLFPSNECYIGQSVDTGRRMTQHRSDQGGWFDRRFEMIPLGSIVGTQAQAEEYEFAWRYKAAKAGWTILARPPRLIVDPTRRMTLRRRWIALWLRWPKKHRLTTPLWIPIALAMGIMITGIFTLTSFARAF